MVDPIEIEIKISNKSIQEFQNGLKKIKIDIPVKQITDFGKSIERFTKTIKENNKSLNSMFKQLSQFNRTFKGTMGGVGGRAGVTMEEKRIEKEKLRMERDRINNEAKASLAIRRAELENQKANTDFEKARLVAERTLQNSKQRMIEKEHNQQLQYRKKEYITFVNGFQNMLRNIPAGQFLAPMLGEKTQGLAQSAQQMMLYKKHQKEIEASGVGAFPFQAKAEKAKEFGIKDYGKTQKEAGTSKGKVLGLAGKALSNPMAMLGGAAAIGLVGKAVSLGFESSPMLQQMFKLWKFGIMMIFRPIGDFFGFLFRPILIMLLRKFIIPNYQKLMPVMIKLGTDLGNFIVKFLDGSWLSDLNPFKDFKWELPQISFPSIDWSTVFPKVDWSTVFPKVDWSKTLGDGWTNIQNFFKGLKIEDTVKTAWTGITDWFKGLKIEDAVKTGWTTVTNWFKGLKIEDTVKTAWTTFTSWFTGLKMPTLPKEVTDFGNTLKTWFDGIISTISTIPSKIWTTISDLPKTIGNVFVDIFNSLIDKLKSIPAIGLAFSGIPKINRFANGGIINEPVFGMGQKSGQGYLVGEAGAERVTPLNKSGGGSPIVVNINIDNMSGDSRDVAELRKTVLDIMQRINANRGR
jgi:hypothetical protein